MDKRSKKKVLGAAAGAAAAATAVGIAAAKMKNRKPTIFHVRPDQDEWIIVTDGAREPSSRHGTKRVAVRAARDIASQKAPSRLIIHRRDGSVQKEHAYQPGA